MKDTRKKFFDLVNVSVRLAQSDEYLKFHEICDNDRPHPLSLEERLTQRRLEFAQIAQGACVAYFAELEGEVVGSVQLRLADRVPDEGRVHALVVRRDCRRLGIGSRLMDAVEDEAWRRGYKRVWLTVHPGNNAARRLYLKQGYTEVTVGHAADGDTTIEMRKLK